MLDRLRLPALDSYCEAAGLTRRTRPGNVQRWDCPLTEHRSRGTFSIDVDRGLWHCFACDVGGDVIGLHMRRTGLSFADTVRDLGADDGQTHQNAPGSTIGRAPVSRPEPAPDRAAQADSDRKLAQAEAILNGAELFPGTPVADYLGGRGCMLPPPDGDLRFVPDLRLHGLSGPAMVGAITDIHDYERLLGLHCTWLRQDGGRWVRGERRYLGPTRGGVIRLWPNEAVVYSLAVGEGIETCLCGAHLHSPVWSCMDAGHLAAFPVLAGVENLVVFADRDQSGTGQASAATCADRWLEAEREVTIIAADDIGSDIADEAEAW